jgi:hypothetical protein
MSLADFVESDIDRQEVVDGQTRQMAGRLDKDPDSGTLEVAKGNLEQCLEVGLTERFDESLMLFRRRLGWSMPFYLSKNAAPRPTPSEDVSVATRSSIKERNRIDAELYRFATELFEDAIRAEGPLFRGEVAAFRTLNRAARFYKSLEVRRRTALRIH